MSVVIKSAHAFHKHYHILLFLLLFYATEFRMIVCNKAKDVPQRRTGKLRAAMLAPDIQFRRFVETLQKRPRNWRERTPVCQWRGVICGSQEEIVLLQGDNKGLQGNLSWAHFPHTMHSLIVSENMLSGTVDFSSTPFTRIRRPTQGEEEEEDLNAPLLRLSLGNNQFHSILFSDLPQHLFLLDASKNNLHGNLTLNALPSDLNGLLLSGNKYSGSLNLEHLPRSLCELDVSFNKLEGPIFLNTLPSSLERLELQGNQLGGTLYFTLLPNSLSVLKVHHNLFDGELFLSNLPSGMRSLSFLGLNIYRVSTDVMLERLTESTYRMRREAMWPLRIEFDMGHIPEISLM